MKRRDELQRPRGHSAWPPQPDAREPFAREDEFAAPAAGIMTTGPRRARRIGQALHAHFQAALDLACKPVEQFANSSCRR
ncbi:MAG: hypothetical protein IT514_01870 [Burkholderiales bacterium]|nr:hypothetical protein [Burkholderiales bacterium]